jgi:hypothetical protein
MLRPQNKLAIPYITVWIRALSKVFPFWSSVRFWWRRGLFFGADFFNKPDENFGGTGEKVFEGLNIFGVWAAVGVVFYAGAACIAVKSAVDVVPWIFATASGSVFID